MAPVVVRCPVSVVFVWLMWNDSLAMRVSGLIRLLLVVRDV